MRILIGANTQKNELIVLDKKITSKRQIKMENEYEYMIDEDLVAIDIGYKENLYFEDEYFIDQIDSYGGVDGIVVS